MNKIKYLIHDDYCCGFDKAEISRPEFECLVNSFCLEYRSTDEGHEWAGPGVVIRTANNPITGERHGYPNREPEPGYCGYIGVYCRTESDRDFIFKFIEAYGEYEDLTATASLFI